MEKTNDKISWIAKWRIDKFRDPSGVIARELQDGAPTETALNRFSTQFLGSEEITANLALNEGLGELIDLICGLGTPTKWDNANANLGVGDSSTTAVATQTGLQAATNKTFKAMDATWPQRTNQTVEWRATFGSVDANYSWQEYTVVNAGSDLGKNLNRKVADKGTKVSGETLDLEFADNVQLKIFFLIFLDVMVVLWLSGWCYRKNHVINPAAGAGAGYQIRVTVHYGAGVDSGENVYCNSLCRNDFGDIRFTDDSNNLLDYWLQSKTDGDNAVFWVEIAANLETTSQTIYVYCGKSDASTTSNQAATFVDVVSGVVGAWNMEETNATDPVHDYSGNGNNGTATGTTITTSPFFAGKTIRQLSGLTDYIATSNGNSVKNRAKVTLELRFKATTLDSNQRCLYREVLNGSTNARFDLTIDATKKLLFRGRAPDTDALTTWVSSNTVLAVNTLYHVVAVFDSATGNHSLYINGVQETANVSDVAFDNTNPNSAPRFGYTPTFILPIAGVVGNANLYADALSAAQVSNLKTNYPDVTLEAGKVLVRKWATSSQPTHDVWGGLERFVVASDSFSAADEILRDKLLGVSDLVGAADTLLGQKGLLLCDSIGAADVVAALKALLVSDAVSVADVFLALKALGVTDSVVLGDSLSVPLRVRTVLDSVCSADRLTVDKALMVAEDVFVVEAVEVGTGDRRTRLFLVLGNVAVQLTKRE